MSRATAVVTVAAVALVAAAPAGDSFRLFDERITESSGLVASGRAEGLFWTHDDSGGGPVLYAIDLEGETRATVTLPGIEPRDWEDIAAGATPDGTPLLHVGDIGDNRGEHPSVAIHTLTEPDLTEVPQGGDLAVDAETRTFTYPDEPQDAETLLTDPATGRLLVVTKDLSGRSRIYATAPLPELEPGSTSDLELVTTVRFVIPEDGSQSAGPVGLLGYYLATGGDVAPTGDRVAIRTYGEVSEWRVEDGDVVAALAGQPVRTPLPDAPQGEAIAYSLDGTTLVATSEGRNPRVDLVAAGTLPEPAPTTTPSATAPAVAPTSTGEPPTSEPTGTDPSRALGTVALAAAALLTVGVLLARRR